MAHGLRLLLNGSCDYDAVPAAGYELSPDNGDLVACQVGYAKGGFGAIPCEPCEPATYAPNRGATE